MKIEIDFDPIKNAKNILDRNLSFESAAYFDFSTAKFWVDERDCYSEMRFVAVGYLEDRLHVMCFTETTRGIRVISFRKANQREGVKHGFSLTRHQ